MAKQYSQITFEFNEQQESAENAGVGIRIKSLKKPAESRSAAKDESDLFAADNNGEQTLPDARQTQIDHPPIDEPINSEEIFEEQPIIQQPLSVTQDENSEEEILDFTSIRNDYSYETEDDHSDEPELADEGAVAHNTETKPKSTRGRKSLKTIDEGADLINIPPDEQLFQKQYYSIGEVAEMFHVNQSLLRFWETEFDIIQPRKNRKGDRHFRPVDIKNLLLIHDLLRRRKLTIEGAKDFLKKNKRSPERFAMIQSLQKIKGFLLEVKAGI
ncbi:MAG: MerR family transcriptional regulator [Flavitalea sp.]